MNVTGITPMWTFGEHNKRENKNKSEGNGFEEVLAKEMEKNMRVNCYRCGKEITEGNVCVINRITWCEKCFEDHVLPEIKIPVSSYSKKTILKKEKNV